VLTNPYYYGIVEYQGKRVLGRHEPLISRELFDAVQAQLKAKAVASDRPWKHEHYLRGSLYCAECGGRLLFTINTGKGGAYRYFSCINRASRGGGGRCRIGHLSADKIEQAVLEHYRTVVLTPEKQAEIIADVETDGAERAAVVNRDVETHERRLRDLEGQQLHLIELSYKGLVSDGVLRRKQRELDSEKAPVAALLAEAHEHALDVEAELLAVLDRTRTPYTTYAAGKPLERRILNQAFFQAIYIGQDSEVVGTTLTPTYAAVAAWSPDLGRPRPIGRHRDGRAHEARGRQGTKHKPRPPFSGPGFALRSDGGDGGNRTRVRDRVQGGVYECVRRSGSRPPLASPAGLRRTSPIKCPPGRLRRTSRG
jgi:site-specific DNA recombinase